MAIAQHTRQWVTLLIVGSVVLMDQIIKVCVKMGMCLHESIHVTDWCYILFTENRGMAFGMELVAKPVLTVFRIVAVGFLIWYLMRIIRQRYPMGYIVCLSLILAGAIGNIIDSVLYGEIFTESTQMAPASLVPIGEGYGTWLHGKVVDMFYFPIIDTCWPDWLPVWGGQHFVFFSPIFNFADAAVSCGVIAMILFYGRTLNNSLQKKQA